MRSRRIRLAVFAAVLGAAVAVPVALAAVTATGIVQHGDKVMHGRIFRDGVPSGCHGKTNPGLFTTSGLLNYDKYSFKNTAATSKCAHVFMQNTCSPDLHGQANAPFVPADPSLNYLGDAGSSDPTQAFDFPVAGGQSFDVVLGNVNGGGPPCGYALTVTIGGVQQAPSSATHVKGATDTA